MLRLATAPLWSPRWVDGESPPVDGERVWEYEQVTSRHYGAGLVSE